jgi:hypothetical protein
VFQDILEYFSSPIFTTCPNHFNCANSVTSLNKGLFLITLKSLNDSQVLLQAHSFHVHI